MSIVRLGILPPLAAALAVSALAACSGKGGSDADLGEGDSAVRTAECPASVDLRFSKPDVFAGTPMVMHDGSPLSSLEKDRVAKAMEEARDLPELELRASLTEKARGRCTYEAAPEGREQRRAVLRTKSGNDILDVYWGKFRIYAFPTSYATTGLTFERGAKVGLFANVDATGAFADGATKNIEIGSTTVETGPATLPASSYEDIPDLANMIHAFEVMAASGPSLEHFGVREGVVTGEGTCTRGTATEAANEFDREVADEVFHGGSREEAPDFTEADLAKGKAAFRAWLGTQDVTRCFAIRSGGRSSNQIYTFIGASGAPAIQFELGYED